MSLGCIILAAGKGQRMKSALPKPLHAVVGRSMLAHVIAAAEALAPEKIVVVTGPGMDDVAKAALPYETALQPVANGTGGAALAARDHFRHFKGDILILYGDAPLVTPETLQKLVAAKQGAGVAYAAMHVEEPNAYGRIVLNKDGTVEKIVEFKDATDAEKAITLCNGGLVCADGSKLFGWLAQIGTSNAQGEYYLTDLPQIARRDGAETRVAEVGTGEMQGVNGRGELAAAEAALQQRLRAQHMEGGATLVDPATVYFSYDTVLGQDVTIGPNVFFGTGVRVGNGVTIHANSHIAGAEIGDGAEIGPFARLRKGSKIGPGAKVGNFVETKNTTLGAGAKASHLSYLGDATIGEKANIGAGTITCNYDGFLKHETTIGREAFIGSNSALVAPVTIGDGAVVAAGSTITQDVPPNALGITRAPQITKEGWAPEFRQKKIKEKATKKDK